MKQAIAALGTASLCLFTPGAPAAAQDGTLAQIFFQKVKPGSEAQFEAGRKRHMAWHKSKGDTWAWFAWDVLTGDNTGTHVVGTFGRAFKDFDGRDEFQAEDGADAIANTGAFVESTRQALYVLRPDMSAPMDAAAVVPTKFAHVIHFHIK